MTSTTEIKHISNKLFFASIRRAINYFLVPVDYTRTKEVPELLALSEIKKRKDEKLKILDISSPQILTLSLSEMSDQWEIFYGNPYFLEREDMIEKKLLLKKRNIVVIDFDICNEEHVKHYIGQFDYVFSCSVFEHIYPEENGYSFCYPCDSITVLAEEKTDGTIDSSERRFNPEKWGTVKNTEIENLYTEPVYSFFDLRQICSACLFMQNNQIVKDLIRNNGYFDEAIPVNIKHINFP